jgi:hypothetical protein
MKVEGEKSTASSSRCIRVYAPLSCLVTVENGCAGPWKVDVGIKILPPSTIYAMLPKNRDGIVQFFRRLYRATDRFTRLEGVFGEHEVPTKYDIVSQKMVACQNNGMAIMSHGGRTHVVHPNSNKD